MRKATLLVGFALVLAACGGAAEPADETQAAAASSAPVENVAESDGTSAPTTDADSGESSESATSDAPAGSSFDGPPAPDFELALSDGSVFKLSEEQKPVYVVFWAEW